MRNWGNPEIFYRDFGMLAEEMNRTTEVYIRRFWSEQETLQFTNEAVETMQMHPPFIYANVR